MFAELTKDATSFVDALSTVVSGKRGDALKKEQNDRGIGNSDLPFATHALGEFVTEEKKAALEQALEYVKAPSSDRPKTRRAPYTIAVVANLQALARLISWIDWRNLCVPLCQ